LRDESIGSFVQRRLDKRLGVNLASAVMHGIYAGDIWQLSARTLLAQAWQLEGYGGSIYKGMFQLQQQTSSPKTHMLFHPYDLDLYKAARDEVNLDGTFLAHLDRSAMFTFKNGIAELTQALKNNLERNGRVDFKFGSRVQDYRLAEENQQQVDVTVGVSLSSSRNDK
jgi:oxygen-dependent protoporphyrinogen oxidase